MILLHGWPLSADSWDDQAMALADAGFRTIAYDRRGFGRSDQPWGGYDYDTLSDDLADVIAGDGRDGRGPGRLLDGGRRSRPLPVAARRQERDPGRADLVGRAVHAQDRRQPERRPRGAVRAR